MRRKDDNAKPGLVFKGENVMDRLILWADIKITKRGYSEYEFGLLRVFYKGA